MALCRRIVAELDGLNAAMYVSEIDLSDAGAPRLITRSGILVELDAAELEGELRLMKAAVADFEAQNVSGGCLHIENGSRADYSPAAEA